VSSGEQLRGRPPVRMRRFGARAASLFRDCQVPGGPRREDKSFNCAVAHRQPWL